MSARVTVANRRQASIAWVAVTGSEIDEDLVIPFVIGAATITPTVAARQRQAAIAITSEPAAHITIRS